MPVTATDREASLPPSARRPISPPQKFKEKNAEPKPEVRVPLLPRKLAKEPATFQRRTALLTLLCTTMRGLNEKTSKSTSADVKANALSDNQVVKLAVEEEENIGSKNPAVYENVLKQRIMALKKMSTDDWVSERKAALTRQSGVNPAPTPLKPVETGLGPKTEVMLLSRLVMSTEELESHGYITKRATEAELNDTGLTIELANHWEVCDRCGTRFQVFHDRRESDGALTTNGPCKHHWGKKSFPKRTKKKDSGPREDTKWLCCNEPVGSPGCTSASSHVFKVAEGNSKRLSTVMPFIETPENDKADPYAAICFDCEMAYTTKGLELIRLTAISWPSHEPVLDILVRPLGHILDLNTRFSGVTAEKFLEAKEYDPSDPTIDPNDLRIVDSPYKARDLLLDRISPTTPLIGHALDNDLNVIRLIHPTVVDTVHLFPHHGGLPYRNSLRYLARQFVQMNIQQGGAAGHDSYEDAKATGELVRFKIKVTWNKLKSEGWTVRDDTIFPPLPGESPVIPDPPGMKRKHSETEDGEGDEKAATEPEFKKQK
jgi:DNA polymerase III epsilon subunit-like protein